MTHFDDETLTAFADGELREPEAGVLRAALAEDAALAARVDLLRRSREAVARLPLPEAPAGLEARLRAMAAAPQAEAKVVPLAPGRRAAPFWAPPLAAAAALAVGLALGSLLTRPAPEAAPSGFGLAPQLAAALERTPSGGAAALEGGEARMIASFKDGAGALCREFEEERRGEARVAVACRGAEGWELRFALATGAAEGYQPASSLEILDLWMTSREAGAPLSPEEEAAALGFAP